MHRSARWRRALAVAALALALAAAISAPVGRPAGAQQDARYFSETGFRIDDDRIWDYFSKRGRVRTFGLPTSRTFRFLGFPTQFFQRHVLRVTGDGVQPLNVLDEGFLPYTRMGGSTFPAPDPAVISSAPSAGAPGYDTAIIEFLERITPDTFEGEPVNFLRTFNGTVTLDDAFPGGGGNPSLLPLINLELWGQPTSRPSRDPNNHDFIYQRFQRGIMHYDANCHCTQGLLLADFLKSLLTGENLADDLAAQASESPFYKQYDLARHNGPLRPDDLADTDLGNAFRPSLDNSPPGAITIARAPTPTTTLPRPTPTPRQATPTPERSRSSSSSSSSRSSSGPTPVPGPPPEGNPKDIVTKPSEVGDDAKKASDKEYADGRQRWYEIFYQRPTRYANYRSGPVQVYSKAIIAKDEETARQFFEEQKAQNVKMPEAKEKVGPWFELNTETADEDLGDDKAGLSACREDGCRQSRDDEFYVHHRIVVRVTNMVGVLYTYGLDDPEGNTKQNARRLASLMVSRWR